MSVAAVQSANPARSPAWGSEHEKMERTLFQVSDGRLFLFWDQTSEQWSVWLNKTHVLPSHLRQLPWHVLQRTGQAEPILWAGSVTDEMPWGQMLLRDLQRHCDFAFADAEQRNDQMDAAAAAKQEAKEAQVVTGAQELTEHYRVALEAEMGGGKSPDHYFSRDEAGRIILDDSVGKEMSKNG